MGYHLTILRTSEARHLPISREEFRSAALSLPALRVDDETASASIVRGAELRATLALKDGEIWTKTPDDDVLAVMLELADRLGARVRGDEMETYRAVGESYRHPDDAAEVAAEHRRRAERRQRRLVWNAVRIGALLIVIVLFIAKLLRS